MKFNKILPFLIITLFCYQNIFAQKSSFAIKRADTFYNSFDFGTALKHYENVTKKNSENLYVKGRIGNCYKFLNKIGEAEQWYAPLANSSGVDPIFKFYYAQSLMANLKYDEALVYLSVYYESIGANRVLPGSFPTEIFEIDERFEIKIQDFNSNHADFSAYKIVDNVFFISNRKDDAIFKRDDVWSERPFTQLYRMKVEEGETRSISDLKYEKPKVFSGKEVSGRYHEGPISFDRVQNDIYMTRTDYTNRKVAKGDDKAINLKIVKIAYVPETQDFGTQMVSNLTFNDINYNVAYPAITANGKYMFFSSDMPGGYGGLDLYVAQYVGGMWTNPVNLGENINTPGNEVFPFVMPDGTLFFSSDGHLGLGGLDIYFTSLQSDGSYTEPTNMKAPINSIYDDFSFFADDKYISGYFSSNRPSSFSDDDIYSFTKKGIIFEAIVYDSKTNERLDSAKVLLKDTKSKDEIILYTDNNGYITYPIQPFTNYTLDVSKKEYLPESAEFTSGNEDIYAEIPLIRDFGIVLDVTVKDTKDNTDIPLADVVLINLRTEKEYTAITNKYGKVSFVLDPESEYRIVAGKNIDGKCKYLNVSKDFNTFNVKAPANLYSTINLTKQCEGDIVKIENIYYDLDKFFIRKDAALELDKTLKVLKDNPTMEIELSSHTDCRATAKYNMWLSSKRAESSVNYLISKGIDYRRLTSAGYGETKLVNECECEGARVVPCTEEQHQQNRRTEFTIIKL